MSIVLGAQVVLQWVKWEEGKAHSDDGTDNVPIYWKYLPGVINSILIILFGAIYKWLSLVLV